jgi:hypothetical protein
MKTPREAPLSLGDKVTWTGVNGRTYEGSVFDLCATTGRLRAMTDTTQNIISFSKQSAKAAGLRLIK